MICYICPFSYSIFLASKPRSGVSLGLMHLAFMVVSRDGLDHGKFPRDREILIHQALSYATESYSLSLVFLVHSILCLTMFPMRRALGARLGHDLTHSSPQ